MLNTTTAPGPSRVSGVRIAPSPPSTEVLARLAREQCFDRPARRKVLVEHAMDGLADRHLDPKGRGKRPEIASRGDAFGDVAQLGENRGQRAPVREREPDAAIARKVPGAGEH